MPHSIRPQIQVHERPAIADLALRLTGSRPESDARLESCVVNVLRRMSVCKTVDFNSYLNCVAKNPSELGQLVSALTIHHTSWFRESVHLDRLKVYATEYARDANLRASPFTVLSAGCSTGEEAYSIALVLEKIRAEHQGFEYKIEGWDVDPVSVATANRAIYAEASLATIPDVFKSSILLGSGKTKGFITLDKSIRDRTAFKARSLLMTNESAFLKFQVIFCRNVLIYFKPEQVESIVHSLIKRLNSGGMLILGHSEGIDAKAYHLESLGNSCYRQSVRGLTNNSVRSSESKAISPKELNKQVPAALAIRKSVSANFQTQQLHLERPNLILVGASTGGTDALERLLRDMPEDCPPIVVVQHIAHAFAHSFAQRLASAARLKVGNPNESGLLKRSHLYMAWGDYHIGVRRHSNSYFIAISSDPARHRVRPSVDYLFESAARGEHCERILVCLMTGMGKDGALGMLELRKSGAMTCTQDAKSSVVFGMPAEAVALGASQLAGTPEELRALILQTIALPENRSAELQKIS